jgi:hypothetical protein
MMIESEKRLRDLQKKVVSDNKNVISEAIIALRNEDPLKGAIGLLVDQYNMTDDLQIKDLIRNFLNDIKEPAARTEIIDEIQKKYKPDTTSMLVCSCWQSGLDYSGFASIFSKVFINGDYLTALECFTVLEESVPLMHSSKKREIIGQLEKNKSNFSVEKNKLLEALITVLL